MHVLPKCDLSLFEKYLRFFGKLGPLDLGKGIFFLFNMALGCKNPIRNYCKIQFYEVGGDNEYS